MKKLVLCPVCESNGKKEYLGEITSQGFTVLRFNRSVTHITGSEFVITCTCGGTAYVKTLNESSANIWSL